MSITLVRPMDLSDELINAVLSGIAGADAPTSECARCYTTVDLDADDARDQLDWHLTDDGDLVCEDCQDHDGPAHSWDRAYWG